MKWAIRIYALILAIYMGYRTFDFMSEQIPISMGVDIKFFLPLLFILATEAGMILWNEAIPRATSKEQFIIANIMVWADFTGSVFAGIADMIIRQTMIEYTVPRPLALGLMIGMPVLGALNIAAAILHGMFNADDMTARMKEQTRWEAFSQAHLNVRKRRKILAATQAGAIIAELEAEARDTALLINALRAPQVAPTAPTLQPPVMPIADVPLMVHTETPTVTAGGNGRTSRNSSSANPTLARRRSQ